VQSNFHGQRGEQDRRWTGNEVCLSSWSGEDACSHTCLITLIHVPPQPIFHEGSKVRFLFFSHEKIVDGERLTQGYLCCKRRVLEFEEFLKIAGCTEGRHLFVPKSKGDVRET
jgi:CHORD